MRYDNLQKTQNVQEVIEKVALLEQQLIEKDAIIENLTNTIHELKEKKGRPKKIKVDSWKLYSIPETINNVQ